MAGQAFALPSSWDQGWLGLLCKCSGLLATSAGLVCARQGIVVVLFSVNQPTHPQRHACSGAGGRELARAEWLGLVGAECWLGSAGAGLEVR